MKVIEPGHIYQLAHLDGDNDQLLTFVNREAGTEHEGTQTQEVLRAVIDATECLVDRTNHCDDCLAWPGNKEIIKELTEAQRHYRRALLFHENRALERKIDKKGLQPEKIPTEQDGHWRVP